MEIKFNWRVAFKVIFIVISIIITFLLSLYVFKYAFKTICFNNIVSNSEESIQNQKVTSMFESLTPVWKKEGKSNTAASIRKLGKGKIAATYMNFGEWYLKAATQVNRDFLSSLVNEIFPDQIVKVKGSHFVDVSLNEIDGKTALNLVNTAGPHDNDAVYTFDDFPVVGPLEIIIKAAQKPMNIKLQPSNENIDFNYQDGEVQLILPELEIHQIIMIEK